jgi:copper chaperone
MKTTLPIQNLKCGGCANTIITRLSDLKYIQKVQVETAHNSLEQAIKLLSKLGYPIDGENNPLIKKATSFVSCAMGRMNKQ